MDNKIYNDKLTPSAKEALDEILIEIKNELLKKANSIAQKELTADKEISLRDIMNAREELFKAKTIREKTDYKRKRFTTIISLTGALYTIIGIFIYVYQNQSFALENNIGLIMAFAGILVILMGFMYTQILFRRKDQLNYEKEINTVDDFELVKRWQTIEKLTSKLMRKKGFDENESKSISGIINFLSHEFKSDELHIQLRELLQIRNKILHEDIKIEKNEKQNFIKTSDKIISLLEESEKSTKR